MALMICYIYTFTWTPAIAFRFELYIVTNYHFRSYWKTERNNISISVIDKIRDCGS